MTLAKVTSTRGGYSKASSRDVIGRDGFDGVSPTTDDRALDSFADLPQDETQTRVVSALIESFVEEDNPLKRQIGDIEGQCCPGYNTWLKGSSSPLLDFFIELGFHQTL
jgi:hypothetical protein